MKRDWIVFWQRLGIVCAALLSVGAILYPTVLFVHGWATRDIYATIAEGDRKNTELIAEVRRQAAQDSKEERMAREAGQQLLFAKVDWIAREVINTSNDVEAIGKALQYPTGSAARERALDTVTRPRGRGKP